MKENSILMSAPMVIAIKEGRKSQTRRIAKKLESGFEFTGEYGYIKSAHPRAGRFGAFIRRKSIGDRFEVDILPSPYGAPGDHLIVKEHAWMFCEQRPNGTTAKGRQKWHYVPLREAPIHYCADHPQKPLIGVVHPETGNSWGWHKKLGRFLPKWASRIRLEIVKERVEWLHKITMEDCKAEGLDLPIHVPSETDDPIFPVDRLIYKEAYSILWESIHGAGSWKENPVVWVIEFRRVQP